MGNPKNFQVGAVGHLYPDGCSTEKNLMLSPSVLFRAFLEMSFFTERRKEHKCPYCTVTILKDECLQGCSFNGSQREDSVHIFIGIPEKILSHGKLTKKTFPQVKFC